MNAKTNNISWTTKAKYIGTGIFIGFFLAPALNKIVLKFRPRINELFDDLMCKTEAFAESTADLLARAQQSVSGSAKKHTQAKPSGKPKSPDICEHENYSSTTAEL